jgi:alpha-galactosidase
MLRRFVPVVFLLAAASGQTRFAPTPPMGWNSWDSYGLSITEAEFQANVQSMSSGLKAHGWKYAVVDEGWYVKNPEAKPGAFQFTMSADGRFQPAVNRFPSAANNAGFKPLADYVHGLGLKFGIHIIRGIPKEAVRKDLPIAGSAFHTAEAADTYDTCPWNADNYGVKFTPAGQAYYDSIARLYAGWGIDFIKVDCIASHPYKPDEIRMLGEALRKTGRPIVLSLSPGPAPIDKVSELREFANMWRISDDVWDLWSHDPKVSFPQSLSQQFAVTANWAKYVVPEHWPDADMLAIGYLGPRPGSGPPRQTRFTHEEQRTLLTLWSIFRSPLFMGGNLTKLDDWTRSLLTNDEVIAVNQRSNSGHEVSRDTKRTVWVAKDEASRGAYVAIFNLSSAPQAIEYPLQSLGFGVSVEIRDLWNKRDLGRADRLKAQLPPHDAALYKVK